MKTRTLAKAGIAGLAAALCLSSCMSIPTLAKPGTAGFYEIDQPQGRVATQDIKARKMSNPEDRVYVYRVNDDMVVLGVGAPSGTTKAPSKLPKSLDEVCSGVVITPDSAKKLAAYLDKVATTFDDKSKSASVYLDFKVLGQSAAGAADSSNPLDLKALSGAVAKGDKAAKPDAAKPDDIIMIRFQYAFNLVGADKTPEVMSFFLGGATETMTSSDVKILSSNLKKP